MNKTHINIISFNIPYPPNYGGLIDVYYKIKALHAEGISIHLHAFEYDRKKSPILESICETVHYYKRNSMLKGFFSKKPFIVESRKAKRLKLNLLANNYPVLFEGLHCCYYLNDHALANRIKIVRMHNNEAEYYRMLGQKEKNIIKRKYFFEEYKRLLQFEHVLSVANTILCIAPHETIHYKTRFQQTDYLAPFHGNDTVSSEQGSGTYALYHGNLSVNENEEAALYLINSVFNTVSHTLIIAGSNPTARLVKAVKNRSNIQLITNPANDAIKALQKNAHIHILPTFQNTGIKLKLINALYTGRFCIVNTTMVQNTGLEKYCLIADDSEKIKELLNIYFKKEFTQADIEFRKNIEQQFSDKAEAIKIIQLLNPSLQK